MQPVYGKSFSMQVVSELNRVRANPKAMAQKLKNYLPKFKGNTLTLPNLPPLLYSEGPSVLEEAAEFLLSLPPLPRLTPDTDLNFAAQTAAEQMGKVKDFNAVPSITRNNIPTRFYTYKGKFGQSTDFGSVTPELVVMNLIIDDGDFQRKNRNMLFNEMYEKVGCGSCKNSVYKGVTVLMYATTYTKVKNEEGVLQPGKGTFKTQNKLSQSYAGKNMVDVYNHYDNHGFNRAKEVLGDNFYTGEYDARYVTVLGNEEQIYLSGIPYRYIHNVRPDLDLITDTAKDPDTRKNFEKLYGLPLKEV